MAHSSLSPASTHTPACLLTIRLVSRWDSAAVAAPPCGQRWLGNWRASRRFHDIVTALLFVPEKLLSGFLFFCRGFEGVELGVEEFFIIFREGKKLKLSRMKLWRLLVVCVTFTLKTMELIVTRGAAAIESL